MSKNKKKLKKWRSASSQLKTSSVETQPMEESSSAQKPNITLEMSEEETETKHEIRKILITIGILILVIVAIYLINQKTDLILKAGEFIVSKLNLSI